MKDTRRNNLYYYNGSTMIGVVATVSSSGEDSEITSLWLRSLGPIFGVVSRYRHDPGKGHLQVVKWVLWYLLKTVDVGLVFERKTHLCFEFISHAILSILYLYSCKTHNISSKFGFVGFLMENK